MNCATFQRLLPLRGLLPETADGWLQQRLAEHAAVCPRCRGELGFREELPRLLHSYYRQELAAHQPQFSRSLPPDAGQSRRTAALWGRPLLVGAAVAALAGGVLLVIHPFQRSRPVLALQRPSGGAPSVERPKPAPPEQRSARSGPSPAHGAISHLPAGRQARTSHPPQVAARTAPRASSAAEADDRYLDGRDPALATGWTTHPASARGAILKRFRLPLQVKDDFVSVPFPRFASTQLNAAELRIALLQYAEEAKVVDSRLFRKVSLRHKGASLEEVCADLQRQTGVRFTAARGVRDEKVTALLEDRPARDVMRELARLFGFFWSRTGEEGAYRYTLETDLRSRLAEEEMRNQDANSALLSLDAQMMANQPLLSLSLDQLREKLKSAKGAEEAHLQALISGGWGGLQIYHRLSPAERVELLTAGMLTFSMDHPNPERRLPPEWRQTLLESGRWPVLRPDGTVKADADLPGAEPEVMLTVNRSEAGQLSLYSRTYAYVPGGAGGSISQLLATGRSASTEKPDNAAANAALRSLPEFQKGVSLDPAPGCPYAKDTSRSDPNELHKTYGNHPFARSSAFRIPDPHLNSADVWDEVHRKTGLPVIADFYSRLYPAGPFKADRVSTFDALCRTGDNLGVRWRKDGKYLLARSTAFFWDKLKEVPRRLLVRWSNDRARNGYLPLEDVIEMAGATPQQLDSTRVGEMIRHCWGLEDWMIVGGGDVNLTNDWRDRIRALGCLTPPQLQAARTAGGLDMRALTPAQRDTLRRTLPGLRDVKDLSGARFRVDYAPSGWYLWIPTVERATEGLLRDTLLARPFIAAPTPEGALAAGRELLPSTRADSDILRSTGLVAFTVTLPDGTRLTQGHPGMYVRIPSPP